MRIKSIVPAIALALAASVGAATALADQLQYLGPSSTIRNGAQGYFTYHDDCDAAFEDSTWCTSQMIIEGGPSASAPDPPNEGEWVNPVFMIEESNDRTIDFSGVNPTSARNLNCSQWRAGDGNTTGLVLFEQNSGQISFITKRCNESKRAACCGEKAD